MNQQQEVETTANWTDYLVQGRFGEAHRAYVIIEGDDLELRQVLATLADIEGFVRDKSWSKALAKLDRLEDPPEIVDWQGLKQDLQSLWESGKALDQRSPEKALETLRSRSTPFFEAEVEAQRGTALVFDNEVDEAKAHFERAVDLDPKHYRAITNLGNLSLEAGNVNEAIVLYERALKLNDDFSNAYHNLGIAYRRKGQFTKSVRMLKRAQRALNRRDTASARTQLANRTGGGGRYIRWILIGGAAVVLYLILRSRGII